MVEYTVFIPKIYIPHYYSMIKTGAHSSSDNYIPYKPPAEGSKGSPLIEHYKINTEILRPSGRDGQVQTTDHLLRELW